MRSGQNMQAWWLLTIIVVLLVMMSAVACKGKDGATGASGSTGVSGNDGVNGRDGNDGTSGTNGTNGHDGSNGVDGHDGAPGQSIIGPQGPSGAPGVDAPRITIVPLCPGHTSYPGVFIEVALCIEGQLYAVYSKNDGFLTLIPPGGYHSNAVGSACDLNVKPNCEVDFD